MTLNLEKAIRLTTLKAWDGRSDVHSRERRRGVNFPMAEVGVLAIAVLAAEVAPPTNVPPPPIGWLLLFPLLVLLFRHAPGIARRGIGQEILDEVRDLVLTTTIAGMAVLSLRVLVADDPSAAAQTVRVWAVTTACLVMAHVAMRWFDVRARERGETIPTLILGAGKVGALTAKRLLAHPQFGLRPVGFLDEAPLDGNGACAGLPVLGSERDLDRVVERYGVGRVVVAFSTTPHETLLATVRRCEELGVGVSLVPRLFERMTRTFSIDHVGGLPLISLRRVDPKSWQFTIKDVCDRIAAALLLVVLAPVLAVVALAVYLSAGRPLLYRQLRVGQDRRTFDLLKFRSMKNGHDDEPFRELPPDTAPGGIEGADRRTTVGKLLRRTSLDELPQLFNVLRGEMSLVGPRPERPEFVEVFERDVYRYSDRHRVKSGITGWAQIHGLRGQTSISDRVEWDNYYIENWSLWLDLKILILTAWAVFRFAAD